LPPSPKNNIKIAISFFMMSFVCLNIYADESDIIKADRQALADVSASGDSSKILAAKEQLSDDLGMEADQRRQDAEGISIPLVPDGQGHFLADVLINNRVHASLVVDTGSPVIMLTSSFVQALGLDVSKSNTGYVELLNGKYKAAEISLGSLKLGDAEAHDVQATVLLEDNKEIKDGLLGLSFLSKFHFTLDQKDQKLILRKLE
jgi:clan AA aspartic protease (TIGR02281 family)